jgi:hypothetical protein
MKLEIILNHEDQLVQEVRKMVKETVKSIARQEYRSIVSEVIEKKALIEMKDMNIKRLVEAEISHVVQKTANNKKNYSDDSFLVKLVKEEVVKQVGKALSSAIKKQS